MYIRKYLEKFQICSIWCQSDSLWPQIWHPSELISPWAGLNSEWNSPHKSPPTGGGRLTKGEQLDVATSEWEPVPPVAVGPGGVTALAVPDCCRDVSTQPHVHWGGRLCRQWVQPPAGPVGVLNLWQEQFSHIKAYINLRFNSQRYCKWASAAVPRRGTAALFLF